MRFQPENAKLAPAILQLTVIFTVGITVRTFCAFAMLSSTFCRSSSLFEPIVLSRSEFLLIQTTREQLGVNSND